MKSNATAGSRRADAGVQSVMAARPPVHQGGHFGHWVTDSARLPAYVYTADQTADPLARSVPCGDSTARADNEHPFLLGCATALLPPPQAGGQDETK